MVLLGFAVSVDFPRASLGFKGDEATYYSLAAQPGAGLRLHLQRQDLVRVWEEFPGPGRHLPEARQPRRFRAVVDAFRSCG